MEQLRLNNKPAIKIAGTLIRGYKSIKTGKASILCDCEGDEVRFPKQYVKLNIDGTILIEEWLYRAKVEAAEL